MRAAWTVPIFAGVDFLSSTDSEEIIEKYYYDGFYVAKTEPWAEISQQ
jgi:hypothetical protein